MPSRPPTLKQRSRGKKPTNRWNRRTSRQARGYGRAHDLMRAQVLADEPLCRICLDMVPPRTSASVIADHILPKAEGGSDDRSNYQGICRACDRIKTSGEAARARRRGRTPGGGSKV